MKTKFIEDPQRYGTLVPGKLYTISLPTHLYKGDSVTPSTYIQLYDVVMFLGYVTHKLGTINGWSQVLYKNMVGEIDTDMISCEILLGE